MCEIKTVLIVAALLLAATGFAYIQQIQKRKWDNIAKSEVIVLAKRSTKSIVWMEANAFI